MKKYKKNYDYFLLCDACGNNKPHFRCQHIFLFVCIEGFAFVYFDDEHDAEDAIRGLDGLPFGYSKRKLSVEWSRVSSCEIS